MRFAESERGKADLNTAFKIIQTLNGIGICPAQTYHENGGLLECVIENGVMRASGRGRDKPEAQEAACREFIFRLVCGFQPEFIELETKIRSERSVPPDARQLTAGEILRGGAPNPVTAEILASLGISAKGLSARNPFEQFGGMPKLKLARAGSGMTFTCLAYHDVETGDTEYIPWEHLYILYGEKGMTGALPDVSEHSGHTTLIRNCGFLGFPAWHTVIPGISETRRVTLPVIRLLSARQEVVASMGNLAQASPEALKNIAGVIEAGRYNGEDMSLHYLTGGGGTFAKTGDEFGCGQILLASVIYYALGDSNRAVSWLGSFIEAGKKARRDMGFYACLMRVFQCTATGHAPEQAAEILKLFFAAKDAERALEISHPAKIIGKLYAPATERQAAPIMRFKDRSPLQTIQNIREILRCAGVCLIEEWVTPTNGCYSLRVNVAGSSVGQNGKGKSPELASASAYAEFMERLCSDLLFPVTLPSHMYGDMCVSPDEAFLSAAELYSQGGAFMGYVAKELEAEALSVKDFAESFDARFTGLKTRYGRENHHALPFYSIRDKRFYYVPSEILDIASLTNGSCAGNTPYEALLQGVSEIAERYAHKTIYKNRLTPPDIPDSAIQAYPEVWEMVRELRAHEGFEWFFKDASLGEGLPVVMAICVNKNEHTYGIRLGAHPSMGVALERTVTEAFQGKTLEQFTASCALDFGNSLLDTPSNYFNTIKTGDGQWPIELFGKHPSYEFRQWEAPAAGNEEMFWGFVKRLLDSGRDVLIRNMSFLGFPVFRVVIPGMSDFFGLTEENAAAYSRWQKTTAALRDMGGADEAALTAAAAFVEYKKDFIIEGGMPFINRLPISENAYYGGEGLANRFFLSFTQYARGETQKARQVMREAVTLEETVAGKVLPEHLCLYRLMEKIESGTTAETAAKLLEDAFPAETLACCVNILRDRDRTLGIIYPKRTCFDCGNCLDAHYCAMPACINITNTLRERKKNFSQREFFEKEF